MIDIDGSYGEGGGQLLRTAIALAALTGKPFRIRHVRAKRASAGLAAQHLTAVKAVAELCQATVEGLAVGSRELAFVPGAMRGGRFRFDVGTAGSITLVLQALLPVMLASARRFDIVVTGGSDVRAAPPLDYFERVLLPLLARLGARTVLTVVKRGYYPRGGGEIALGAAPSRLVAANLEERGKLLSVAGAAHVAHLPEHIALRMRNAALARLRSGKMEATPDIAARVLAPGAAHGPGGAVVLWAQTERTVLGAGRVAQRGVPAERLGEEAAAELCADLAAGATLDVHAADQLLIYLSLAGGRSAFLARELSTHAETAMWLIGQFLPVNFSVTRTGPLTRVEVMPG